MRRIAIGVLAAGLSISAAVLVMTPSDADGDNAGPYAASVDTSKTYRIELEQVGGESAVVIAEVNEWFSRLWHGKRLAGTLAALSVAISLLCFLAANLPPMNESRS